MKIKLVLFILIIGNCLFGQGNLLWKGYFSYNEIVDVSQSTESIYAVTDISVFYKNQNKEDVTIINSINGLKPELITCVLHTETLNKILVGNANGLLLVVNNDGSIAQKVDIIEEIPVPPNKKKINNLYEYNGKVYIATDYGISVFDLTTLEFVSTYFIGTAGEETEVLQTTILNDEIYAVTRNIGIRKASLLNPLIYDFSQWQTFDAGYWTGIITFNNELVAMNTNNRTYRYNGNSFVPILNQTQPGLKIKTSGTEIIVTTLNNVYVLNEQFIQTAHVTAIPNYNAKFTAATVVGTKLYIGTQKNGLFETELSNPFNFNNISPNGPLQNYIFRVKKAPNYLWTVYGRFTKDYNPYPSLDELGISSYSAQLGWETIPYTELLGAKSISNIGVNPNNPNQVYFSSYFSGLLKLENKQFTLYNETNTGSNGLEDLVDPKNPNYKGDVRINSPVFDKQGNLWVTNGFVEKALKVLRSNGQWQSYDISSHITSKNYRFANLEVDKNFTKWIPTSNDGLIAFNDTNNNKVITINVANSNLPDNDIRSIAIDTKNQLWIGTFKGLRILPSVDRFLSEDELITTSIIIQEDDLAQELFYQQSILDIAVDGANRKWVSIEGAGVFLVSPNGQQTVYRFDKKNSPLPSNTILDIEIDGVTGEVFFATDKGMISFLGVATKPNDNLADVYVYPNPVRPNFTGTIKIAGLTDRANVKITDIEGNLVYEVTSAGGTIEWDGTAFGKYKVASGVYMVFVASEDGLDSIVKKVMIIR